MRAQNNRFIARETGQQFIIAAYFPHFVNLLDQHYLWASLVWGAIASGYWIYGWRQKSTWPLVAGALMTVVSIFIASALLMSLICIAMMFAVYWLMKRGY